MQTLAKHLNLITTNIKNKNLLATEIQFVFNALKLVPTKTKGSTV